MEKIVVGICLEAEGENGGIYQYTLALLDALIRLPSDRFDIVGICLNKQWKEYCEKRQIRFYVTKHTINTMKKCRRFFWVYGYNFFQKSILNEDFLDCKKKGIDICFFPATGMNAYYNSVDSICPIHDMNHRKERQDPEVGSFYAYVTRDILYKNVANKAKAVLADSELGKQYIEEAYFNNIDTPKIKVLPFIAPDYVYNSERIKKESDWDFISKQLPSRFFFYPAQLWIHKNHITIIRAINILKQKFPDIHIVFAGTDKNASHKIRKAIKDLHLEDNITILGYVSNYSIIQLYKKAVALIMASYHGPTNIPQLEAFYLGCPVVVADVYAVHEQVKDAAFLFPPFDYQKLSYYMEKLWTDEQVRNILIEKGKKRSLEWGLQQFSERVLAILEQYREEKGI